MIQSIWGLPFALALRPSHPVTLAGGPGRSRFMANDSGADTRCILHTPRVLCIAHSAPCIAHSARARESRRHPSRKHHRAGQRSGWDRRGHPAVLADPISSPLPSPPDPPDPRQPIHACESVWIWVWFCVWICVWVRMWVWVWVWIWVWVWVWIWVSIWVWVWV